MPDTMSLTLVKSFTYRGQPEEWSNTYHFSGADPADDTAWKALVDALAASERTCFSAATKYTTAYGYKAGVDHAAYIYDWVASAVNLVGTATAGAGEFGMSGDQAGWIRARVSTSSKGKPVYVRKYFHGGFIGNPTIDHIGVNLKAAYAAHATLVAGGALPGGRKWCAPQGALATLPQAGTFVTTRTLKRRGKRP